MDQVLVLFLLLAIAEFVPKRAEYRAAGLVDLDCQGFQEFQGCLELQIRLVVLVLLIALFVPSFRLIQTHQAQESHQLAGLDFPGNSVYLHHYLMN